MPLSNLTMSQDRSNKRGLSALLAKTPALKCKSLCWSISETLRTQVQKSPCIKPQYLLRLLGQRHNALAQADSAFASAMPARPASV